MRSSIGLFAAIGLALSLASGAAAGPLRAARTSADVFTGETQDPYVLAVRDYGGDYGDSAPYSDHEITVDSALYSRSAVYAISITINKVHCHRNYKALSP
jgi:hypothetical protein